MMHVLFVTNIPSPYQIDFFSELERQKHINFHVIFTAASEADRQFSLPRDTVFSSQIMPSKTLAFISVDAHYVPGMTKHLKTFKDTDLVVISGSYFMPAALQVKWWAQRNRIPWLYWGENPWKKDTSGPPGWKKFYLRRLLSTARGALGVGKLASEAYKSLLRTDKPVINLPYAPNLARIAEPSKIVQEKAQQYRHAWGVINPEIILFSGALSHRKAPDMLAKAFIKLSVNYPQLCLLFAGDGPMRSSLENKLRHEGLGERVRFLGFIEGDELIAAYVSSDLFVLPTRTHEGWGVVVQEALAAGRPVLVSDSVGSGIDLVDRSTGRIFLAGDQESLEFELNALLRDSSRAEPSNREARITRAMKTGSKDAAARVARAFLAIVNDIAHDSEKMT